MPTNSSFWPRANNRCASPGYDHLGLLQDTRKESTRLPRGMRTLHRQARVSIKRYEDLVYPGVGHPPSTSSSCCRSSSTCRAWSARNPMRFDHMELTVPVGSLTATLCKEIDDFYGSIFGWSGFDIDVAGRPCRLLMCGSDQFIQLLEGERPLRSPAPTTSGCFWSPGKMSTTAHRPASATPSMTSGCQSSRVGPGLSGADGPHLLRQLPPADLVRCAQPGAFVELGRS